MYTRLSFFAIREALIIGFPNATRNIITKHLNMKIIVTTRYGHMFIAPMYILLTCIYPLRISFGKYRNVTVIYTAMTDEVTVALADYNISPL